MLIVNDFYLLRFIKFEITFFREYNNDMLIVNDFYLLRFIKFEITFLENIVIICNR